MLSTRWTPGVSKNAAFAGMSVFTESRKSLGEGHSRPWSGYGDVSVRAKIRPAPVKGILAIDPSQIEAAPPHRRCQSAENRAPATAAESCGDGGAVMNPGPEWFGL